MSFIKLLILAISLLLLNGCSENKSHSKTNAEFISLQILPDAASVPIGLEQPFTAIAHKADGSIVDVTDSITTSWLSTNDDIARISSRAKAGIAIGVDSGHTAITASYKIDNKLLVATAQLTVNDLSVNSLSVTPATTAVPVGLAQQFAATAHLSDGSARDVTGFSGLTWSSSDTSIALLESRGKAGRAMGLKQGDVKISASGHINGALFSDEARLVVTDDVVQALRLTPAIATVPAGLDIQFLVTALLSSGSAIDVTDFSGLFWSSSDTTIVEIQGSRGIEGNVAGLHPGQATITATGQFNGTKLTASARLTITSPTVNTITISPFTTSVPIGIEKKFKVIATLSDGSAWDITGLPGLQWKSSNLAVATLGSKGMVSTATGLSVGESTISVSGTIGGKLLNASASLVVNNALLTSLSILPNMADVPKGFEQSFTATGTFSDGSNLDLTLFSGLKWSSSDTAIAALGSRAKSSTATGLTIGTVTIMASTQASGAMLDASTVLNVTDATPLSLTVSPSKAEIAKGLVQPFIAIASFSDGSTLDVTDFPAILWTSSDTSVAVMGQKVKPGQALALRAGSSTITADYISDDGLVISSMAQLGVVSLFDQGCRVGVITLGDKTYTCPLLSSIADSNDFEQMTPAMENGLSYARMNYVQANTLCGKLGESSRLPSNDELLTLYSAFGNIHSYAGWPVNNRYRSSTKFSADFYHLSTLLDSGFSGEIHDGDPNYVSCVTP